MTTPRTLTVRSPEDVLALVVSVLGFQPADSVVIVTRTVSASFHARADLPAGPEELEEIAAVTEHLAEAAAMNLAQEAILVTYTGDRALSGAVTLELTQRLQARGVTVGLTVREHLGHWYRPEGKGEESGTEYDLAAHPFVLESHFRDREIYRDRAELAASLRGPAELVARTKGELAAVAARLPSLDDPGEVDWARARVHDEKALSAAEVARFAVSLGSRDLRDRIWMSMDRANAGQWRRRLKEIVRATPAELVAEPAALLGFASWLSGDGALAWCAVDLAREADPGHTLASLVAQALEAAVPPSTWEPPGPGTAAAEGA